MKNSLHHALATACDVLGKGVMVREMRVSPGTVRRWFAGKSQPNDYALYAAYLQVKASIYRLEGAQSALQQELTRRKVLEGEG